MPPLNLLLVVAEELRADALSCYGNPFCPTPTIDALARRGVLFPQHYTVHSKCVPSRVGLITATHPSALGCRDLATYPGAEHDRNAFTVLRGHGYRTALIGKNHVMPANRLTTAFDVVPEPGQTFQNYRVDNVMALPARRRALLQGRLDQPASATRDWLSVDQLAGFIDECAGTPFAAWLNFENAHPPYACPEPYWSAIDRSLVPAPRRCSFVDKPDFMATLHRTWQCDRLTEADFIEIKAVYHAQVLMVDAMMARVQALLDARGLLDSTMVVFTSDHGDWAGEFGLVEKWDTAFHDDLLRIPLMIAGPGIPAERRLDGFSENIDVMPTVFELLGLPRWERAQHGRSHARSAIAGGTLRDAVFAQGGIEGSSLTQLTPLSTNSIYWGKHACLHEDPLTLASARMLRTADAKLVVRSSGRCEFYDMANDPGELVNRWDDPACAVTKHYLMELLVRHSMAACPTLPGLPTQGATA